MKAKKISEVSGFTLIELLVVLAIFSILMAILYPTFSSVSNRVSELGDKQVMTQKGQRVVDYVGEEFRLAGLFVGSSPSVIFCGEAAGTDSIMHVDGGANDTVTILTSERIKTTQDGVPFLSTTVTGVQGDIILTVNVPDPDAVSAITPATGTAGNARAFITFDTLKPNLGALVYQVRDFAGDQLTVMRNNNAALGLDQVVNRGSNAYSVVRKRFTVASRALQLQQWKGDCTSNNQDLVSSWGPGNNNGGVDGFEVEYTVWNPATNTIGTQSTISDFDVVNVRSMTVWLLLRSDFPSKSYVDNNVYTLGQVTVGPFTGDASKYRRVLVTKTVEVKNVRL